MKPYETFTQESFDAAASKAGPGKPSVTIVNNGVDANYVNTLNTNLQNAGFNSSIFHGSGLPGVVNTLAHSFTNIDIANAVKIAEIATAIPGANALGFAYPNLGYVNMTSGNFALNLVPKQN